MIELSKNQSIKKLTMEDDNDSLKTKNHQNNYIICLVNTSEDVVIMTESSCKKCLYDKTGIIILRSFSITTDEISETKKYIQRKPFNVNCICSK